jgi:hypothetical protein
MTATIPVLKPESNRLATGLKYKYDENNNYRKIGRTEDGDSSAGANRAILFLSASAVSLPWIEFVHRF